MDANIKKKEYVRTMRSDFGTSTSEHQIATNIAIITDQLLHIPPFVETKIIMAAYDGNFDYDDYMRTVIKILL